MEDNYYSELIKEINELIDNKELTKAFEKITEELKMPYIPRDTEEELIKLIKLIRQNSVENNTKSIDSGIDVNEVCEILFSEGDDELHAIAIDRLKTMNVRSILDKLQEYLLDITNSDMNKTFLLFVLKEQEISTELTVKKRNQEFKLKPNELNMKEFKNNLIKGDEILQNTIYQINPSIYNIAKFILENYFYTMFPIFLEKEEKIEDLAAVFIYKAFELIGDKTTKEELNEIISFNDLKFDTILNRLEINKVI